MTQPLARTPTGPEQHDQPAKALPTVRIGVVGGLVGIFCCVGPTVLALLGMVSAGTAYVWSSALYDGYAWWFRTAGLATSVVLVWVALQRRRQCSVKGMRSVKAQLGLLLVTAVATYASLYVATTWLGSIAVG